MRYTGNFPGMVNTTSRGVVFTTRAVIAMCRKDWANKQYTKHPFHIPLLLHMTSFLDYALRLLGNDIVNDVGMGLLV